jgi:hypothetical protein
LIVEVWLKGKYTHLFIGDMFFFSHFLSFLSFFVKGLDFFPAGKSLLISSSSFILIRR